jgi:TonB-linked SusC/RagA family outer membrane protein
MKKLKCLKGVCNLLQSSLLKKAWKPQAKFLLVLMFFFSVGMLYSQDIKVTGTVVDENDEPLIGVTISVVGANSGGVTDLDGKFSLSVPPSATQLEMKYLGMKDLKVPISADVMYVKMTASNHELEEVVVSVAYGTQKRNALTGAVTSLNAKEIEQRPVTSVTALLEGKMGIMVQGETGQPGSSPSVRIRGFGSVNGSNSPLYVVDGFVFEGDIADINSQDIAEVSVLKDASSAAIYGNRAANGVIIITTKKGYSEKPHISLVMNQGFDQRNIPDYERLGTDPWMEAAWMGYRNQFISQGKTLEEANALANANLIPNYLQYNIYDRPDNQLFDADGKLTGQVRPGFKDDLDWFKAGTRNGHRQEYIISGDGRIGAQSDYYFSAGYLDQQGYTPEAEFKRFSGRAKINLTPTRWFKTGFNIAASHQEKSNMVQSGNGYTSLFHHARNIPPIYPVHLHDMTTGEYLLDESGNKIYDNGVENGRPQLPNRHTIWENQLNARNVARKTMTGNLFAEISFLNDFKLKVSGNLDAQVNESDTYESARIGDAFSLNGRSSFADHRYKGYTFLQQLTYNKTINDRYHLDVLAAHENFSCNDVYASGGKTDEIFAGIPALVNFTTITSLTGYEDNRRTESYLSRVQLNYDEKYFLDGSFRRDGSSRFHRHNRWGNFYSVGAAWNLSKEAFMEDGIGPVNNLKLRANYGETGNDASVGMYGYMALYSLSQNAMKGALIKSQLEAPAVKWEAATSFGLALDGRVWDRLRFSIEYFDKRSRDLLFDVLLPQSVGAYDSKSPVVTKNIGSVSNRGVELNLSADIIRTNDFTWQADLNLTTLKNKIRILPEENRKTGIITGNKKYTEGHSIYDFWTYQYAGVDQMTGRSLYELNSDDFYVADPNGAPAPDGETRKMVPANHTVNINGVDYVYKTTYARRDFSGSAIPKLTASLSSEARYKEFALSVLFSGGLGNKVMDGPYRDLMQMGSSLPTAFHKDVLKSWNGIPDGMTADSPNRIDRNATPVLNPDYSTDNNAVSNRWLVNGSYLMFKNINLSWSLPKDWLKGLDLSAVRVNLTAENLHLFAARKGLNAQMSFNGEIASQAAAPRIVSLGVKADF